MESAKALTEPQIIPRSGHIISRANISRASLKVLYQLKEAGFGAYLVGGCVRDMLLGREPKDFDVATDARPEEVKRLFRRARLIGRRFKLVHVRFGDEIVEVATFRGGFGGERKGRVIEDGLILRDNVYGTLEEDAWRRDFTINALYYNIRDFSVVDYVSGMEDLERGLLRLIGDPEQRYREDPVRMLRAVRFAAKLGFRIHPQTEAPLFHHGPWLQDIPSARLFEETLKLFLGGYALETFELLRHYGLFGVLFPLTEERLRHEEAHFPLTFLAKALENTDARLGEGKPVTPAFLFAALLWEPVRWQALQLQERGKGVHEALQQAGEEVMMRENRWVTIPKRHRMIMREIWNLQPRLARHRGKRALKLLGHPSFRAAYDFLMLRVASGEEDPQVGAWWTQLLDSEAGKREAVARPRRRRRPRKSA